MLKSEQHIHLATTTNETKNKNQNKTKRCGISILLKLIRQTTSTEKRPSIPFSAKQSYELLNLIRSIREMLQSLIDQKSRVDMNHSKALKFCGLFNEPQRNSLSTYDAICEK